MQHEQELREALCDIGQRLYARQLVAGSDGNISCRLTGETVLCTPTLVCKGLMKPEDLCVVDFQGNLVRGRRSRTSEVLLHLEIYQGDPKASAVVHAHPPHATAYAAAHRGIPPAVLPEIEIFLGRVPLAPYETPGTPEFARTVRPYLGNANTVLLANHGVVSWAASLERAYGNVEMLDSYCRILMLADRLGGARPIPGDKLAALARMKAALDAAGSGEDA